MEAVQKTTAVPRKVAIPRGCLKPSRTIQNDPSSRSPFDNRPSDHTGKVIPSNQIPRRSPEHVIQ